MRTLKGRAEMDSLVERGPLENILEYNQREMFNAFPHLRERLYFKIADISRMVGKRQPVISKYIKRFSIKQLNRKGIGKIPIEKLNNRLQHAHLDRNQVAQILEISRMYDEGYSTPYIQKYIQMVRRAPMKNRFYEKIVLVRKYNCQYPSKVYVPRYQLTMENFFKTEFDFDDERCRDLAYKMCIALYDRHFDVVYLGPDVRMASAGSVARASNRGGKPHKAETDAINATVEESTEGSINAEM